MLNHGMTSHISKITKKGKVNPGDDITNIKNFHKREGKKPHYQNRKIEPNSMTSLNEHIYLLPKKGTFTALA